jgi:CheY-like chemotaxis protein
MRAAVKRAPQLVILLVDDNRDGLLARCSVLEEHGYKVLLANSGPDAIQALENQNCDLVITDYKMASMDGLELISKLRQRNIKCPIILLTGYADSLSLGTEGTGADIVLEKSADEVTNLVRCTKRLLQSPKKNTRGSAGQDGTMRRANLDT